MSEKKSVSKITTTGHELSSAEQLDAHFIVSMPDYKAMLHSVGIEKGWHVLDAACGTGSFLPFISELVGADGKISAMDLAPENVYIVNSRFSGLACRVETEVGDLTDLPYPDNVFDAVWCANASEFLTDEALTKCVSEFKRVTKPGGLIAIKEYDVTTIQIHPIDPFMMWRLLEGMKQNNHSRMLGMLRTMGLSKWLTDAGLVNVRSKSTLSEWWAPLTIAEKEYFSGFFQYVATLAEEYVSQPEDLLIWRSLHDPQSPKNPINSPELYFRESHMVFVAQKPVITSSTVN